MRILFYSDSPAVGGAEIALGYLLRGLDPSIETAVLGVDRAVCESIASARVGTAFAVVPSPRGARDVAAVRAHVRAVRAFAPDILHANQTWPLGCSCGEIAGLLAPGVRVLAVHHLPLESAVPRLRLRAGSALARRLDRHVAVGERVGQIVERYLGLPPGTVRAIPNGVPPAPAAEPRVRSGEGLSVAALGRLTDQKHLDGLVRALAEIPQMTLTLVGDGPEREALRRQAEALGVGERLTITGWVSESRAWLSRVDVLALSSLWEGMPLAILEAMHAGLPVVATDVGSVAEAVSDGVTGYVVAPGDDAMLVDRLRRLGADPVLRARMGEDAARTAGERFTVQSMARGYEAVYRELLGPLIRPAAAR